MHRSQSTRWRSATAKLAKYHCRSLSGADISDESVYLRANEEDETAIYHQHDYIYTIEFARQTLKKATSFEDILDNGFLLDNTGARESTIKFTLTPDLAKLPSEGCTD
ncbi:hypothetical protein K7432_007206 [Basidiobolus ranarum]|uniref:Uncharacterized protein n=1 Tax=Basidiobolus ranarum TaxID=34480 RepID=A0ABR2WTN0_9FUNG